MRSRPSTSSSADTCPLRTSAACSVTSFDMSSPDKAPHSNLPRHRVVSHILCAVKLDCDAALSAVKLDCDDSLTLRLRNAALSAVKLDRDGLADAAVEERRAVRGQARPRRLADAAVEERRGTKPLLWGRRSSQAASSAESRREDRGREDVQHELVVDLDRTDDVRAARLMREPTDCADEAEAPGRTTSARLDDLA